MVNGERLDVWKTNNRENIGDGCALFSLEGPPQASPFEEVARRQAMRPGIESGTEPRAETNRPSNFHNGCPPILGMVAR